MGHINLNKNQLITELSEAIGFKSGLVLSYEDLLKLSGNKYLNYIETNKIGFVRIESSEYENLYFEVLKNCGYMPKNINPYKLKYYTLYINGKYGSGTKLYNIAIDNYKEYIDFLSNLLKNYTQNNKVIYPSPLIKLCESKYGIEGTLIVIELLKMQNLSQHFSPYFNIRRVEWQNQIELKDLFESEKLDTLYGSFIDQRYIDYLSNNE